MHLNQSIPSSLVAIGAQRCFSSGRRIWLHPAAALEQMDENHFLQLPGPTNIYGLASAVCQEQMHILVATRSGVYCAVPHFRYADPLIN